MRIKSKFGGNLCFQELLVISKRERRYMFKGKGNAITNTLCPYYIRDSQKQITCEGVVAGAETSMKFESEERKLEYQKQYCFLYPNECMICKGLDAKYQARR